MQPKWTVLYTTISSDSIKCRNRLFFYNKLKADVKFREFQAKDQVLEDNGQEAMFVPTIRPYDNRSDFNCWEQ